MLLLVALALPHGSSAAGTGPFTLTRSGELQWRGQTLARTSAGARLAQRWLEIGKRRVAHLHLDPAGTTERSRELVVLLDGARTELIADEVTGTARSEGAVARRLRVDPRGIVRYETRAGFRHCDGKPLMLFPHAYDFSSRRFRPVLLRREATQTGPALRLRAQSAPPAGLRTALAQPGHSAFRFVAATTQKGASNAAELTPPVELSDHSLQTSWIAGHLPSANHQSLVARRPGPGYPLVALRITVPADARPMRGLALATPDARFEVRLLKGLRSAPTTAQTFYIPFAQPATTSCLELELRTAGARSAVAALASVEFMTSLDTTDGDQQLAAEALGANAGHAARALAVIEAISAHAPLPLVALAKGLPTARLTRLWTILSRTPTPASTRALLVLLHRTDAASLHPQIAEELRPRASTHLEILLQALHNAPEASFVQLVPLLAHSRDPRAFAFLLRNSGQGTTTRRRALVSGLAASQGEHDAELLLAAIGGSSTRGAVRQADLVCAAGLRARRLRPAQKARLLRALTPLFAGSHDFELRYRIVHTAAALDDVASQALLLRALRDKDALLRWQGLEVLARLGRLPASLEDVAAKLCADSDPRVRAAAARLLGRFRSAAHTNRLIRLVEHDRWPRVAIAAATSLGERCAPRSFGPLAAVAFRRGNGIDHEAIAALVRCRAPNTFEALLHIAASERQPPTTRQHALSRLSAAAMRGNEQRLLALWLRLLRRAAVSDAAERVASASALALGRARYRPAAEPLAHALALNPSPAIRLAAATALGKVCGPSARRALGEAIRDPIASVRSAAQQGQRQCATPASVPQTPKR